MVWRAPKPNLRLASCCSVEVMKGAAGLRVAGFDSTAETVRSRASMAATARVAAPSSPRSNLSSFRPSRRDEAGLVGVAARGGEERLDGPVLAGAEGLDLHLALDDEAERHRLDAAGGLGAGELAPEDGREPEADEVVERAAGEVGVDELHVDLARVLHRLVHRRPGDGVEGDAGDLGVLLHRLAAGEGLEEVPGDRLALAVGVGGEDELAVGLQRLGDGADVLLALRRHLPLHREVLVGVDRAVLGRQVAHVPVGGEDGVAGAEVLVDGFRLGGRFDDDDGHGLAPAAPRGGARSAPRCDGLPALSTERPRSATSARAAFCR